MKINNKLINTIIILLIAFALFVCIYNMISGFDIRYIFQLAIVLMIMFYGVYGYKEHKMQA